MPLDLASFNDSIKKSDSTLQKVCQELDLDKAQCRYLEGKLSQICTTKRTRTKGEKRPLTKWQQCIVSRRTGKKFDPQAIKELAKEYHAGRCPP